METEPQELDWRARKKAATRQSIQGQAMRLFLDKGFEATTVEEIAAAAGVSHMTFFRYFKTKEDAAVADDYDPLLASLLAARPAGEPVVEKFRQAFAEGLARIYAADGAALLTRTRFILNTPALRGRLWDSQDATRMQLIPALAEAQGVDPNDIGLQVVVAACLATAATAVRIWAEIADAVELPILIDRAFRELAEGTGR